MKKSFFLPLLFSICTFSLHAVDFYGVEVSTSPKNIYVGQIFQLNLSVIASQNVNVDPQILNDLPSSFELFPKQQNALSSRIGPNQRQEFVHTFSYYACATNAFSRDKLLSSCVVSVTTPINSFFGRSWQTTTRSIPAHWDPISIQELPTQNRPLDFSGAIGSFSLDLKLEPSTLSAGDIATLSLSLTGTGNLGNATPSLPLLPPNLFRSYSPKSSESGSLPQKSVTLDAKIVPLSTQAVEIASASFSFFDPASGTYKTAHSKPIHISFCEKVSQNTPAIRTLELSTSPLNYASTPTNSPSSFRQLYLTPSTSSLPTHEIQSDTPFTILEQNSDGTWIRIQIKNTPHTGWLPTQNNPPTPPL